VLTVLPIDNMLKWAVKCLFNLFWCPEVLSCNHIFGADTLAKLGCGGGCAASAGVKSPRGLIANVLNKNSIFCA